MPVSGSTAAMRSVSSRRLREAPSSVRNRVSDSSLSLVICSTQSFNSSTPCRSEARTLARLSLIHILGRVIDSVENNKALAWFNGERGVMLAIQRQPGTNTVQVVDNIRKLLPTFRKEIPPAVNLQVAFDASESIRGSIGDVQFTLALTICLVVMVIFLFLRNLTATLIPGIAVPFSIIGTFAVMYLLGYSLNKDVYKRQPL